MHKIRGTYLNIVLIGLLSLTCGCVAASKHKTNVQDTTADKITVGKVQREIKVGMSGADVISVLGSPNIVSTDSKRREVWVYDKISTEQVYSKSSGFASLILIGGNQASGASSTSQRTLTIIVKFDDQGLVRDFAYRQSSF
ncbi:outer membrane protein assembly factor BamE [Maridesulfovibrio sp.]|uniref:outer membrane protein assembly factor BamE domain-containing protein n=1 Tax=Maridesulfovibrio sp. TaxID=2795000 RepID=UPI0029C9FC29|nr:outer membrane protein assembly factor BamE [Maridesulfovibrio sp.]